MRAKHNFLTARTSRQQGQVAADPTLERAKNIATIMSAIAIPLVITVAGYFIQRQLADEGLKKDYVGIATGILKENSSSQEPELRAWAVRVLEENSPVPFTSKVKASLLAGPILAGPAWLGPPDVCLRLPKKRTVSDELSRLNLDIKTLDAREALLRMMSFVDVVIQQEDDALQTRASLECVIRWAKAMEKSDIEYRKSIGARPSKEIFEEIRRERAASAASAPSNRTTATRPKASTTH